MNAIPKAVSVPGVIVALAVVTATSWAATGSEVAALHAADDAWLRAYSAGRVEDVVALYDENAMVCPPEVAPLHGRAAIQAYFEEDMADFAESGLTMSFGANYAGGSSGDLGWSSGTWMLKDKTGTVVDSGWYFSVSKKVGGKWLYVRDAWNSDHEAAAEAPTED